MTRELGLFSLKIFLIINLLTLCCLPVRTTLIRKGKQNELINPSSQPQITTETETSSLSTTEISNSDSVSNEKTSSIVSSSTVEIPNNSVPVEISSTTITNEEITKPTIQTFLPQQQQQQPQHNQQQQLYPWNIMWNSAQSILPIIPPSWWPYSPNQQNPSMHTSSSSSSSSSTSSSSTNNLQATPVASLTLTFGKTSVNKGIGSNTIGAGGSSGVGIFGCPPPIVISGVCPEATCNCQCDNNNKKIMPSSIPTKPIDTVTKSTSSSSPSFFQIQKQQQSQGFLPFQSWQDFFLKPVQLITSRTGRNVEVTSTGSDEKL